jgi:hypothetical protein
MNIDSIPRIVTVKDHPFFKETMYCFCRINTRDIQDILPRLDVDNDRISCYWTADQIKQFNPNVGTHEFRKTCEIETVDHETKFLKKRLRNVKRTIKRFEDNNNYNPPYDAWKKDKINLEYKLEQMKSTIVIFVQINLDN